MRIAATLLAATLANATSLAHAEHGPDCSVTFVRAPDEVRLVIERWLKAEPHCAGSIELRVVETETGSLYLIAQRPDGRIHEREVPDAQSAGVLVASWIADDWTSAPPVEEAAPPRILEPAPPAAVATFATAPRREEPVPRSTDRWITLSAAVGAIEGSESAARGEVDLVARGKLTLGVTAGFAHTAPMYRYDNGTGIGEGTMDSKDLFALVYVARVFDLTTQWHLRAALGVGIIYSKLQGDVNFDPNWTTDQGDMFSAGEATSGLYEGSLLVSRDVGTRWSMIAGPVLGLRNYDTTLDSGVAFRSNMLPVLMVLAGARYRL